MLVLLRPGNAALHAYLGCLLLLSLHHVYLLFVPNLFVDIFFTVTLTSACAPTLCP